jgi:nucleoside-diphosphate-sugar epimerase
LALFKANTYAPETVIHLAGCVSIALQASPGDPASAPLPGKEDVARNYAVNVGATANVLDYCLHIGVRHLIFASSQAIYGMPQTEILTEDSPCAPLEHYAASKLCCECLLQVGARQGVAVTVLRFPGVFGEERKNGVVYKYCQAAISSKKISVIAHFPLPFDVIHIDDVVDGIEKVVQYGGHDWTCLNLAYGEPCNVNLLADEIAELVPGCQVEHSKIPQPVVQMDVQRTVAALGWRPQPRRKRLASMLEIVRNAD